MTSKGTKSLSWNKKSKTHKTKRWTLFISLSSKSREKWSSSCKLSTNDKYKELSSPMSRKLRVVGKRYSPWLSRHRVSLTKLKFWKTTLDKLLKVKLLKIFSKSKNNNISLQTRFKITISLIKSKNSSNGQPMGKITSF